MELTTAIAQRIVDRAASSLQQGVSVTGLAGVILAGDEGASVGSVHPLARRAIADRTLAIDQTGPLPGLSLPLVYRL